jgi:hypothetical protein
LGSSLAATRQNLIFGSSIVSSAYGDFSERINHF